MRRLLELEQEFAVVGDTDHGDRLVSLAVTLKPDVILLDPNVRKRPGIEALREITDRTQVRTLLFKAVLAVAADEYWLSHAGIAALVQNLRLLSSNIEQQNSRKTSEISPQQTRIVEAIAAGCSNKEIAEDLSLSERTVKYHLTRIFSKFGVSGRMELARFSLKNKLVREA